MSVLYIRGADGTFQPVPSLQGEAVSPLTIYPVGSIYMSVSDTSPASLFGGTWERIEGRFLMGASDTHPAGTTVEAGLPNITGKTYLRGIKDQSGTRFGIVWDSTDGALTSVEQTTEDHSNNSIISSSDIYGENESGMIKIDASASNPIYGASDTVQPPAYSVYIWRRVA